MEKYILTVTLNPCIDKTIEIDGFEYGGLNRALGIRCDAGGKGINVSKVLKGFGEEALNVGFIAGSNGEFIKNYLDEKGIKHSFTKASGDTRTNYKLFDKGEKITTEINEPGFYISSEEYNEFLSDFEALLPSSDTVILSGSTPPGVKLEVYSELIKLAKKGGARTILDADSDRLKFGMDAVPYVVKPNLYELCQYTGKTLETEEKILKAAKSLIEKGIKLVVLSMGKDGAIFVDEKESLKTVPFEIDVKSTVGAGDTMVSAIAYGLKQGYNLEKIAAFSTSAGTMTASKEGTQVAELIEVLENSDRVKVIKL
ncbi:MAG: 1-phosphofructokinase [Bacillota bacterium]|nr:1-phosphofructokinase [Bacillota bacterium]